MEEDDNHNHDHEQDRDIVNEEELSETQMELQ